MPEIKQNPRASHGPYVPPPIQRPIQRPTIETRPSSYVLVPATNPLKDPGVDNPYPTSLPAAEVEPPLEVEKEEVQVHLLVMSALIIGIE